MSIVVTMRDGSEYTVKRLLTDESGNAKLSKSAGREFLTVGLSLAASDMSGYNVCPNASPGCRAACLVNTGQAWVFKSVNRARIAKTIAFFTQRQAFLALLRKELRLAQKRADKVGKQLVVRLNVFSDLAWEKLVPELFTEFNRAQFYDYTKIALRAIRHAEGRMPSNYHLTFSRSETNERDCKTVLAKGGNVTVVFENKDLPGTWNGVPVVNGDETDLRFLDPQGVVVGLYVKGPNGKKDESGFVVPTGRIPLAVV